MSSVIRARTDDGLAGMARLAECRGLAGLLRANAQHTPDRAAFLDQARRDGWSGRDGGSFTFATADLAATRLARFLGSLGLSPRAMVGVCLPGGSEAPLVMAALERAGLTACLLPVAWSREMLAAVVEDLGIACVVTQSRIGNLRPADTWREIAAGYFGLRFILAFGPSVPDGVIDLDRMIMDQPPAQVHQHDEVDSADCGYVSFDCGNGKPTPYFRSWSSSVASARVFLSAARYDASDRIISLLAQDDHRSLTTGLVAALAVGASIELHGLFSSAPLLESLGRGSPAHIVAPGWMEPDLARLDLGSSVRGIVLVHQAPVRFKARAPLTFGVVDALAFGELAVLAKPRNARGQFALSLDTPAAEDAAPKKQLLSVRRNEDGEISFCGPAAEAVRTDRHLSAERPSGWQSSGYTAEVFAGIVIGVS
jgi:mycobactin salicyl-AMP ligase